MNHTKTHKKKQPSDGCGLIYDGIRNISNGTSDH